MSAIKKLSITNEEVNSDTLDSFLRFNFGENFKGPKRDKFSVGCYFNIDNHTELLQLGRRFHSALDEGRKSFAFAGVDSKDIIEETVMGLSAYYNYDQGMKTILLVDEFDRSLLKREIKDKIEIRSIENEKFTLTYYETFSLVLFDFFTLKNIFENHGQIAFEEAIRSIFLHKNCIHLMALPDLEVIKDNLKFYYPFLQKVDSVGVVVKPKADKESKLRDLIEYFNKSNIRIEGMVLK